MLAVPVVCQGCFHPSRRSKDQAALSFTPDAATTGFVVPFLTPFMSLDVNVGGHVPCGRRKGAEPLPAPTVCD